MFDDDQIHAWLQCVADNAWISLHYESPAIYGLGRGEISGGGYVRRQGHFSTPSARTIWSIEDVKWVGLPAVRLSHFGIWSHKNKGKLRAWGALPDQGSVITPGSGYVIREGLIALSLD